MEVRGTVDRVLDVQVTSHGPTFTAVLVIDQSGPSWLPEQDQETALADWEELPHDLEPEYETVVDVDPQAPSWLPSRLEAEEAAADQKSWAELSFKRLQRWYESEDEL